MKERLESLDLLRGFDMFLLVCFCPLLIRIPTENAPEWFIAIREQFTHCTWQGLNLWDLVMPLFLFCTGTSIPFALSKFKSRELSAKELIFKITKRLIILWLLGMFVQGNLSRFENIKLFSNTLQAIAIGYFFSALIFVYLKRVYWYLIGIGLLLLYWLIFATIGNGDWSEITNIAQYIDRSAMGVMVDGAAMSDAGQVVYASWYYNAWLLPSMNFIVTVLTGVIAGDFIKNNTTWQNGFPKFWWLMGAGLTMLNIGWAWDNLLPIVKPIWSSSMVLVSSGWCFVLLSLFYLVFDVCKWGGKWTTLLRIYSTNAIVAYVLTEGVNFSSISNSLFGGLAHICGAWNAVIIELSNIAIVLLIVWLLYKNKIFIRI